MQTLQTGSLCWMCEI